MADMGETNPEAGVMATSPATAPVAAPSTVGFFVMIHSIRSHPRAAAAVAVFVLMKALTASSFAASALPALNPNQPNQSSAAPTSVYVMLCGGGVIRGKPFRLPMTSANTSAEIPEETCTTVPPGEVEGAQVVQPAVRAPHPVGDGIIDERRPEQGEHREGGKLHPLRKRAGDERRGDDREHHLVDHEELVGNGGRVVRVRRQPDPLQAEPGQVADERCPTSGPKARL